MSNSVQNNNRVISVDVFRAITMVLMIWVNDFWTLNSIPKWLKHASSGEDYLGFSDVIFPWFLFVMGMSLPFAFRDRFEKKESEMIIWKHIILRTVALLVMGLFHMNMEMYNHDNSIFTKPVFVIISTCAFFMIWNRYPNAGQKNKNVFKALQIIGVLLLVTMFLSYSGKGYDGQEIGFKAHWWGILGLIGWVYFIAATTFLFINNSILGACVAFFVCLGLNILSSSGVPYNIFSWQSANWIPGGGGLQALTFGGIIVSLLLIKYKNKNNIRGLYITLFFFGLAALLSGILLRNYFIISKISGTPTWILISLSTAVFLFICLHWVVDIKKYLVWYKYIKIAGTATLTCYLVPYFYYSFRTIFGLELPNIFLTGITGLIKSFIYTFIIIGICWILNRGKVRLKI